MSSHIKNIPKNIYLQVDMDGDTSEIQFKDLEGVSWYAERVNDTDLKFQLNQTDNRLFTKEDMIAFATYVPEFKSIIDKREFMKNNFDTWAFIRK